MILKVICPCPAAEDGSRWRSTSGIFATQHLVRATPAVLAPIDGVLGSWFPTFTTYATFWIGAVTAGGRHKVVVAKYSRCKASIPHFTTVPFDPLDPYD